MSTPVQWQLHRPAGQPLHAGLISSPTRWQLRKPAVQLAGCRTRLQLRTHLLKLFDHLFDRLQCRLDVVQHSGRVIQLGLLVQYPDLHRTQSSVHVWLHCLGWCCKTLSAGHGQAVCFLSLMLNFIVMHVAMCGIWCSRAPQQLGGSQLQSLSCRETKATLQ